MNEVQRIIDNCAERGVPAPESYAVTESDLSQWALALDCTEQDLRDGRIRVCGMRVVVWPQL